VHRKSEEKRVEENDACYIAAGAFNGISKLVNCFFVYMPCGWPGRQKHYSEKYGAIQTSMARAHLLIDEPEWYAWLMCMQLAIDEQPYAADFKDYQIEKFFIPAERMRTVGARLRAGKEETV
jgi:hypothetical protein